jgi:hypothetical protein
MAPGPRMRRVVLSHVHAVGPHLEGQVGPVVEEERDAGLPAHLGGHPGPGQQGPGLEVLVA